MEYQFDAYSQYMASKNRFTGSVAVQRLAVDANDGASNNELHQAQCGLAFASSFSDDIQRPNEETQFRIGSISKMFTSVLVLQLIEEGLLTLDSTLDTYFPSIANSDLITIEHMLRHTSGLRDYLNQDINFLNYYTQETSREELLAIIEAYEPLFGDQPPGSVTSYSNTNFLVLGWIVEDVVSSSTSASHKSSSSYGDILLDRIATPLNMNRTAIMVPPSKDDNVAFSFTQPPYGGADNFRVVPVRWLAHPSVVGGAGAIMSTATDLVRFMTTLMTSPESLGLSDETLQLMLSPVPAYPTSDGASSHNSSAGYNISNPDDDLDANSPMSIDREDVIPIGVPVGLGIALPMAVYGDDDEQCVGHNGALDQFLSLLVYCPESQIVVAVLANTRSQRTISTTQVGESLYRIAAGQFDADHPALVNFDAADDESASPSSSPSIGDAPTDEDSAIEGSDEKSSASGAMWWIPVGNVRVPWTLSSLSVAVLMFNTIALQFT